MESNISINDSQKEDSKTTDDYSLIGVNEEQISQGLQEYVNIPNDIDVTMTEYDHNSSQNITGDDTNRNDLNRSTIIIVNADVHADQNSPQSLNRFIGIKCSNALDVEKGLYCDDEKSISKTNTNTKHFDEVNNHNSSQNITDDDTNRNGLDRSTTIIVNGDVHAYQNALLNP